MGQGVERGAPQVGRLAAGLARDLLARLQAGLGNVCGLFGRAARRASKGFARLGEAALLGLDVRAVGFGAAARLRRSAIVG